MWGKILFGRQSSVIIREFIQGKNPFGVVHVGKLLARNQTSEYIKEFIVERNLMNAMNMGKYISQLCIYTREFKEGGSTIHIVTMENLYDEKFTFDTGRYSQENSIKCMCVRK